MSAGLAVLALVLAAPPYADTLDLEKVVAGKARLVRFQVEIDGKSCRLPWEEYERRLFADLDRDGNGHLDRKEAVRVPSAAFLRSLLQADTETETGEVVAPFTKLDRDGDGRIQREELLAYYRGEKVGPLVPVVREVKGSRGWLSEALFQRLDVDGDDRLSREELSKTYETLSALDLDEDEWLTISELAPRGRSILEKRIVAETLRPRFLPNGDRKIERVEVVKLMSDPAPLPPLKFGVVSVVVETVGRIESGFPSVRRLYLQDYQACDAENRGFVEKQHLEDADFLRGLLPLADRDSDGKLTPTELKVCLDLHAFGAAALVMAAMIDESRGLFDLLDADSDNRLSPRELKGSWERLRKHDSDGDGKLSRTELPCVYRLRFSRGFERPGRAAENTASPLSKPKMGPLWFQHMDRNGDGDVSLREFVGPLEVFRSLDRDGDGLLSKDEAERQKPE